MTQPGQKITPNPYCGLCNGTGRIVRGTLDPFVQTFHDCVCVGGKIPRTP
jgi:hypothetical protein